MRLIDKDAVPDGGVEQGPVKRTEDRDPVPPEKGEKG